MSKAKRIERDETGMAAVVETPIENTVEAVKDTITDLPSTVTGRRDTAIAFVKDHPGLAIAGGIAVGVLAAALLPRRPKTVLGKRGAKLGDAVSATATLLAREAISRAEASGTGLRRGSRKAAKRSEQFSEQAVRSISAFLSGLISQAGELSETASSGAEKLGKSAGKRLADAGDAAESAAAVAGRRIGKVASEARSKIIG